MRLESWYWLHIKEIMNHFKLYYSPFPLSKRKQLVIIKTMVPFIGTLMVIAYIFRAPRFSESPKSRIRNKVIKETDGIQWSEDDPQENKDEFLEVVLEQLNFTEVDLEENYRLNINSAYDKNIENLEKKVVPAFGAPGARPILPPELKTAADLVLKKDAFNRLLSEMIPVNRTVPDTRELECRKFTYDINTLPSMSIIIIFTNEAYISIIRMLHSLINKTPENLLKEIILVDDFSDHADLKGQLERYLETRFLDSGKIRLLRLSKRSGLMRARMIGAHVAEGDVLMFLDAHCEMGEKWSEPLLQRIVEKRDAVVVPIIDIIDSKTLVYNPSSTGYFFIGGFKWSGHFYWIEIPEHEEKLKAKHYDPTRTPTMAGGLFAIDRKYFWEMGSYDPYMLTWGGENLEMSFRIWQCGGSVETIPCSHVGHIFRPFRPYSFDGSDDRHNVLRLASVWMDEYKKLVYDMGNVPNDIGDLTRRLAFRERKRCNSFQWYLDNIYPQKFKLQYDSKKWGQVRQVDSNMCLDDMGHAQETSRLHVYPCHPKLYPSQTYYLSKNDELRRELFCAKNDGIRVQMVSCDHKLTEGYKWNFDDFGRIVNRETKTCLAVGSKRPGFAEAEVILESCNFSTNQKWQIDNYNATSS